MAAARSMTILAVTLCSTTILAVKWVAWASCP